VRDYLIEQIYSLEEKTNIRAMEDFRIWSNSELLDYYGCLRVEEYYQDEQRHCNQDCG
jgi:hypothetical protein